jgi:hypothetical protein
MTIGMSLVKQVFLGDCLRGFLWCNNGESEPRSRAISGHQDGLRSCRSSIGRMRRETT